MGICIIRTHLSGRGACICKQRINKNVECLHTMHEKKLLPHIVRLPFFSVMCYTYYCTMACTT